MTLTESERQSGPPADPQLPSPIPWSGSRPVKQDGPRWSPEPSRQDHDTQGQPWLLFPSFLFRPPLVTQHTWIFRNVLSSGARSRCREHYYSTSLRAEKTTLFCNFPNTQLEQQLRNQ